MVNWLLRARMKNRAGLRLAVACALLCILPMVRAQVNAAFGADSSHSGQPKQPKQRPLPDRLPDKPSLPPTFTVPVEALGFSAPAPSYLGLRWCFVSLGFLDENRLLFTFRVPGLIHRDPGESEGSEERQIRAVVVALPEGKVESEALWTVHDRVRYLWTLKDGHFLLRDREGLEEGDARLELKSLLQFPGPLLWLQLDPSQEFMVTNSLEPATEKTNDAGDRQTTAQLTLNPGDQGKTDAGQDDPERTETKKTDLVLRILHRESGQVLLVSRVHASIHLPINADGYLDSLRGNGQQWLLSLNYFSGGSKVLGRVESACSPALDFVSQREVLVTGCTGSGERKLVAMDMSGYRLWEDSILASSIWPMVVVAPDGSRLAQETLAVTHSVTPFAPLDSEDIKGQFVRVFNAADGKVALEAPASPALDSGGNVAISPSGRRVAILNAGAIQVFDLPPAPPLPEAGNQTGH
jgi:hypothetical protein